MARLAPDVARLKLKWAFGFPGATRSVAQPTVFGGGVYREPQWKTIRSRPKAVHVLAVRSRQASSFGRRHRSARRPSGGVFGDFGANVYAIHALTGKPLWITKVDDHPAAIITGAPTLVGTTLFVPVSSYEEVWPPSRPIRVAASAGSLVALDSSTGKVLWKTFTIKEEPRRHNEFRRRSTNGTFRAPIWSAPTFDPTRQRVYATTGDNYSDPPSGTSDAIIGFDARSGDLAWTRQITSGDAFTIACPNGANSAKSHGPDFDFGSSAVLATLSNGSAFWSPGKNPAW